MRAKLYRGWWYAVWREGGETKRRALRTQDRDEALRALADYQRAIQAPRDTVAGIWEAYQQDRPRERAAWAWKRLKPTFGHLRPDQIDGALCRAYAAQRRQDGAGDGTIHTELTFLRAALNWHAAGAGHAVELPAKPAPNSRHLTRAEYARLLGACVTPHVRLFVVLALATAGRMGAILDLTWDRVNLEAGMVRLANGPQTRKRRATVPLTDAARRELAAAYAARTSTYVIEYGGERVGKIRKAFDRAAEAAGLAWVTPHALRHTAAVWMAEAGVPMAEIAQYLGHTSEAVTFRVYARFSPAYLRRAAGALEV
ncbi:MAG TPA: site-specific integrase [Roseococcus sp.]|jgi:integrase|nr:site-specific integrase [Roseococcus sp.]